MPYSKLHQAASHWNEQQSKEEMTKLIAEGHDVNLICDGKTALDCAAENGRYDSFIYLLEQAHTTIDYQSRDTNLLEFALYASLAKINNQNTKGKEIAAYLMDPERRLWERFNDGTTELHIAAAAG